MTTSATMAGPKSRDIKSSFPNEMGVKPKFGNSLTAVRINGIDPSVPTFFADALSLMQMGHHSHNPVKNLDLCVFYEEPKS